MNLAKCNYTPRKPKIEESGIIDAVYITADYNDFDKENHSWQESYFTLLSWKNTWGIPLAMDIRSTRSSVYLMLAIPYNRDAELLEHTLDMLEDGGYRNVQYKEVKIMLISPDWLDEDEANDYMIYTM